MIKVLVVHEILSRSEAAEAELDTIEQSRMVAAALSKRGHQVDILDVSSTEDIKDKILRSSPNVVFMLVESLHGRDERLSLAVRAIEETGIPYTGSNSRAVMAAMDKIMAKTLMSAYGVSTPDWLSWHEATRLMVGAKASYAAQARYERLLHRRVIVKPVVGGGALGISNDSIFLLSSLDEATSRMATLRKKTGQEAFIEEYIDGREYKVGAIAGPGGVGVEILPPTEMDFSQLPKGHAHILTHEQVWGDSDDLNIFFQDGRLSLSPSEADEISATTRKAVHAIGGRPPYRLDIRRSEGGEFMVTDVNLNCSVSEESSLYNSAEFLGISYEDFIERLVFYAVKGKVG